MESGILLLDVESAQQYSHLIAIMSIYLLNENFIVAQLLMICFTIILSSLKFGGWWPLMMLSDILHLHLLVGCSVDVYVILLFLSLLYCGLLSSSSSSIHHPIYLYGLSCL